VYSLGVTLYELLVGRLPVDPNEIGAQAFMSRLMLKETDPPTPSTRYSTLDRPFQDAIARFRRTDPGTLRSEVTGDLDWIVMKAIEKDRERRYETANALAADLERYLNHEPVLARPPSAAYRTGRFVRRHRWGVGVAAAALLLVLAFSAVIAGQAARIARERDLARYEALKADTVLAFMTNVLADPDPDVLGPDVTVMDAIDSAIARLPVYFEGFPDAQAATRMEIGNLLLRYDRYEDAWGQFLGALELFKEIHGSAHPSEALALDALGDVERRRGDFASADTLYGAAIQTLSQADEPDSTLLGESLVGLGLARAKLGRHDEAAEAFREGLAVKERVLIGSPQHQEKWLTDAWEGLAETYKERGQFDSAISLYRRSLATRMEEDATSTHTGQSMNNLAAALDESGQYEEAERYYRGAIEIFRSAYGGESSDLLTTITNLALLLDLYLERYEEADALYREALVIAEGLLAPNDLQLVLSRYSYAAFRCEVFGDVEFAVPEIEAALPIVAEHYRPEHIRVAAIRSMLGYCLTDLGRFEEAEQELLAALDSLAGTDGPEARQREAKARERLVRLYEAWGRPERADMYRGAPEA